MNLNFKHLSIKGFFSIESAEIDLNDSGLVSVVGRNLTEDKSQSNGSGKSSIFEAIIYVLTGKTLRGSKEVINIYSSQYNYTEITLSLSAGNNEYIITRTRNHPDLGNNLIIKKDGEDISGDKLKKSESILASELPFLTMNYLSSCIVLGQGMPNKFTALSPLGRKERLEELTQTSEVSDYLKGKLNELKEKYSNKYHEQELEENTAKTQLSSQRSYIDQLSNKLIKIEESNKLAVPEDSILTIKNKLLEIDYYLNKNQEELNKLSKTKSIYSKKLNEYNIIKSKGEASLTQYKNELESVDQGVCPTCHQPLNKINLEEYVNTRQKKISEILSYLSIIEKKSDSLAQLISNLEKEINQIEDNKNVQYNNKYDLSSKLADLKSKLAYSNESTIEIKDEIERSSKICKRLVSSLDNLSKDLKSTNESLDIIKYLERLTSKEFRSFLLLGAIDYLNNKLKYYSEKLLGSSYLSIELDKSKVFLKYKDRSYESLSGGEKQKVDLSMQFSLRDLVSDSVGIKSNLLVIDEGFDNLDEEGVSSLLDLIISFEDISSIFNISHHSLSVPYDALIEVEKDITGVSRVKCS